MSIFFGKKFRKIAKQIHLKPTDALVDIGCGSGNLLRILHKKFPKNKLTGLDIDPKILKIARKKIPKEVKLIKSSAAKLPFSGHSVEVVTSTLMIHHLETSDKEKMIKEIYRILKPGGQFFLFDFARPTTLLGKILTTLFKKAEHMDDALEDKYSEWIKKAGFQNQKILYRAYGMMELIKTTK